MEKKSMLFQVLHGIQRISSEKWREKLWDCKKTKCSLYDTSGGSTGQVQSALCWVFGPSQGVLQGGAIICFAVPFVKGDGLNYHKFYWRKDPRLTTKHNSWSESSTADLTVGNTVPSEVFFGDGWFVLEKRCRWTTVGGSEHSPPWNELLQITGFG